MRLRRAASDSEGEDSDVSQTKAKKKKHMKFLQNKKANSSKKLSGQKPPRIKRTLKKKAKSLDDIDDSDDDHSKKDKKSRFGGLRKRNHSADDSSIASASNNSRGGSSTGLFGRKKRLEKNVSFRGGVDGSVSTDDDSVREKPRGLLRGKKRTPRGASYDSSDDEGINDGRPPRAGGKRDGARGVSFQDLSGRGESGDDSEYGYDSSNAPTPRGAKNPARERARYSVYHGQGTRAVKRKFRVRPYRAFKDPVHMTEEEIYADSLEQSKQAEFLKSYLVPSDRKMKNLDIPNHIRERWGTPLDDGRIGSLRVEILGCVSLNRSKPDVCAYAICGDAAFATDVINGYRSPMWPSACKRAAVFPLHHAFAKLFVGVFDVRKRTNKENDVFCGRVVIDISNLRPDTDYDTTMPLRASSFVYDKRKRGVIRLRFSVHWFSERAAVCSYFKPVKTFDSKNPLISGQPVIPCSDPKTFRNVAYTVHGQDLPGKYSRMAFRSSMREMNLYQVNMQQILIVTVLDAMFYENPWISAYLFASAMYCVYFNTMAMVPAICVGYVLLQYLNNYRHYIHKKDFNFGYKPLTMTELSKALLKNGRNLGNDPKNICFYPIEVDKWTKRRGKSADYNKVNRDEDETKALLDEGKDIRPLDHREFPFSERDAYPNFGVEDALAPGSTKGDSNRLHGRLSVYYSTAPATAEGAGPSGDEDEESDLDSEHDDETVMTESQMMGDDGFDMESSSDEDDDANLEGADYNYKRAAMAQKAAKGKTRLIRRVKLGPPQDADVKGKKIPPQVTLKKMENLMYKFSRSVSVEFVHGGPSGNANEEERMDTGLAALAPDLKAKLLRKQNKAQTDEYDKILGYQVSYTNPIQRIMSSFMGPVMRMMRVGIFIVRILYNLSAWRDPFLSFWLLVVLVSLFLIFIVFPWRGFFFLMSIATIGPQNLFLRKILERKAKEKLEKKKDNPDDSSSSENDGSEPSRDGKKKPKKGGFFASVSKKKKNREKAELKELAEELDAEGRTTFCANPQYASTKRIPPRAVVVPYTRLKKDRFYDWPPDPTVSRATPVPVFEHLSDDDSFTNSLPDVTMEEQEHRPVDEEPGEFVPPNNITFNEPEGEPF